MPMNCIDCRSFAGEVHEGTEPRLDVQGRIEDRERPHGKAGHDKQAGGRMQAIHADANAEVAPRCPRQRRSLELPTQPVTDFAATVRPTGSCGFQA